MAIKIKPAIFEDHILEKSDKLFENTGEPTTVKIRKVTQGENESRNSLFSLQTAERTETSIKYTSPIGIDDVNRREVFLSLAACNITDSEGNQLFKFKNNRLIDEGEFVVAWGQLEPETAFEIIEKVHITNLQWVSNGKK